MVRRKTEAYGINSYLLDACFSGFGYRYPGQVNCTCNTDAPVSGDRCQYYGMVPRTPFF